MAAKKAELTPVLITTTERSIYFGYINWARDRLQTSLEVTGKRHVFRYVTQQSGGEKGCYALCTTGPQPGSCIGPAVDGVVHNVHSVQIVSDAAVQKFSEASW